MKSKIGLIILLASLPVITGCGVVSTRHVSKSRHYYLNPELPLSQVGRVLIVELRNDSGYPQVSADITDALFKELQKEQLFGVDVIRSHDPLCRILQLGFRRVYTLEELSQIYHATNCDAILIGVITNYEPFPHTSAGLELRMIDVHSGGLIWAMEDVWDAADKEIADRISEYYRTQDSSGQRKMEEHLVKVSPMKFTKFVVSEVVGTMEQKQ